MLQEKLFSLGDDYVIRDEGGREAFRVDGKVLTLRDTLILEDPDGNRRARDTYGVEIADGEDHALILACAVAIDRMCHEEEEPG
jgi:uncharacterized protein YxjI